MKKIILILLMAIGVEGHSQTAKVQFIHNSPDVGTKALDVYFGDQVKVDSITFRTATPYLEVPANANIVVAVQSADLPDTTASLNRDTLLFEKDSLYVVVIAGLVSSLPYDSLKPFELDVHKGRITSKVSGEVDALFYHGNIDGPTYTIEETTQPINNFIPNLPYGTFDGYIQMDDDNYEFELYDFLAINHVISFDAPFSTLGFADSAIVVLASGFIDSLQGQPGDSTSLSAPFLGLWVATPGGGPLIELPVSSGIGLVALETSPVEVYPNPAKNFIRIKGMGQFNEGLTLKVHNLKGEMVVNKQVRQENGKPYRLDVSALNEGMYVLEVFDRSGNSYRQKVLIR